MVPSTVGWVLLHQLIIKTISTETSMGQLDPGNSSDKVLLSKNSAHVSWQPTLTTQGPSCVLISSEMTCTKSSLIIFLFSPSSWRAFLNHFFIFLPLKVSLDRNIPKGTVLAILIFSTISESFKKAFPQRTTTANWWRLGASLVILVYPQIWYLTYMHKRLHPLNYATLAVRITAHIYYFSCQ